MTHIGVLNSWRFHRSDGCGWNGPHFTVFLASILNQTRKENGKRGIVNV